MANPLDLAAKHLGMNETDQRAALTEYLSNGGARLDPAVTAWCAAYVNATLQQSGYQGTGSNLARDFLKWGEAVDTPQRGDIAVFSRGDPNGPYGHVGFFDGYNEDGTIRILGGNQGDSGEVSLAGYGQDRLLGFRRPQGGWASQGQENALAAPMPGQPRQPQQNQLRAPTPEDFGVRQSALDPAAFMRQRNQLAFAPINVGVPYGNA